MSFLYHARPAELRGETLYPLNELRRHHPDLYEREREKYVGREALSEFRIPLLDVYWNDVLHLAPLHPSRLAAAWATAGLSSPAWEREFFQIPVERIAAHRSVWFAVEVDEFRPFDVAGYEELGEAPAAYSEYLQERQGRGRPPRPFATIPHVLVAGAIVVSGLSLTRAVAMPG